VIPLRIPNDESREVQVKPGQVYRWKLDVWTRAGHRLSKGSLIEVLDFTTKTPHGEISQSGRNWVCRDEVKTSVWATLEALISDGAFLELLPEERKED
jgi:hypothetical protein